MEQFIFVVEVINKENKRSYLYCSNLKTAKRKAEIQQKFTNTKTVLVYPAELIIE